MEENKQLYRFSYQLGDWLILFIKLQAFCVLFILKGGIVLGIFPAITTVIHYFFLIFQKKERPHQVYFWFKDTYKSHFKAVNQLGYILLFSVIFLWIDLRISSAFLQNSLLHMVLTFFLLLMILVGMYLFPVYLRYTLNHVQYFKCAFMLMVISIPQTIAIILGLFAASIIATFLPILIITAFIPMLFLPISWFSFQAIMRAEQKHALTE